MKAINNETSEIVAIKLIKNCFGNKIVAKRCLSEVQLLNKLTNMKENIFTTHIKDVIFSTKLNEEYLFLIMDYMQSDLKQILLNTKEIDFNESHILTIMYNTLSAVNFIHNANIIHRDIKPANILIDEYCQIKICDFGMSRTLKEKESIFKKL